MTWKTEVMSQKRDRAGSIEKYIRTQYTDTVSIDSIYKNIDKVNNLALGIGGNMFFL